MLLQASCIISQPLVYSNWSYSPETANLGQNRRFFFSRVTLQFDVWPWKTIGHLFYSTSSFVQHFVAIGEFKLELQSGNAQFGSNSMIFRAVWPWNLTDDFEQGKSEGFDSWDRPSNLTQIGFKSSIFQPVWPWNLMDDPKKTIGHLFYATLSFVHHFVAIGEFKLELEPGNAQSGSNLTLFRAVWPWNLMDDLENQ